LPPGRGQLRRRVPKGPENPVNVPARATAAGRRLAEGVNRGDAAQTALAAAEIGLMLWPAAAGLRSHPWPERAMITPVRASRIEVGHEAPQIASTPLSRDYLRPPPADGRGRLLIDIDGRPFMHPSWSDEEAWRAAIRACPLERFEE